MRNFCYTCVLIIVLHGCSAVPIIYGVPQPEWQKMSTAQQQQAMRQFERQQAINEQTRAAADQARETAHRLSEQCQHKDMMTLPECQVKTRRRLGF